MKKFLTILFLLIFSISPVFAKKQKDYHINFRGDRYTLLYSIKSPDFGGYLNEYYKTGETYNTWSEMLAVHHFPNAYSPIDQIKQFREYLGSMNCPSALTFNDKKNEAMIDFILINNNQVPIILEFNVFKYQKSKKCGSVALQYAKRYAVTTAMQVDEAKRDFEKSRKKIIKSVKKYDIPTVVAQEIDKCKFATEEDINKEVKISEADNQNNNIEEDAKQEEKDSSAEASITETKNDKIIETEADKESKTVKSEASKEQVDKEEKQAESYANTTTVTKDAEAKKVNNSAEEEKDINIIDNSQKENPEATSVQKTEYAPIPTEEKIKNKKQKKEKAVKEKEYVYSHDNSEFYAEARDYKKLRKEKKKEIKSKNKKYTVEHKTTDQLAQKQNYKQIKKDKKREIKEKKKQQKLNKKRLKLEKKAQTKKGKKERAKKAAKVLEEN